MSKDNEMTITVLDDGSIQVITDDLSGPNHMNADNLVAFIAKLAGGKTKIEARKKHGRQHTHSHSHASAGGHKH